MNKGKEKKLLSLVADSYEKTAHHFDLSRQKHAAAGFMWGAARIKKEDVVLDAACGNGRLLDYVSLGPNNYLGLDQSSSLLEKARERHPEFSFLEADLNSNFSDSLLSKKFSLIFCSALINHLPSSSLRLSLFSNFNKLLPSGGKLVISSWKINGPYRKRLYQSFLKKLIGKNPYSWRDLLFPWKNSQGQEVAYRYYHFLSRRTLRRELEKSGFAVKDVYNDRGDYWFLLEKL